MFDSAIRSETREKLSLLSSKVVRRNLVEVLMFHLSYFVADISLYAKRLMSATAKPIVIFVLGGPGAGKGTQCEKIVQVSETS